MSGSEKPKEGLTSQQTAELTRYGATGLAGILSTVVAGVLMGGSMLGGLSVAPLVMWLVYGMFKPEVKAEPQQETPSPPQVPYTPTVVPPLVPPGSVRTGASLWRQFADKEWPKLEKALKEGRGIAETVWKEIGKLPPGNPPPDPVALQKQRAALNDALIRAQEIYDGLVKGKEGAVKGMVEAARPGWGRFAFDWTAGWLYYRFKERVKYDPEKAEATVEKTYEGQLQKAKDNVNELKNKQAEIDQKVGEWGDAALKQAQEILRQAQEILNQARSGSTGASDPQGQAEVAAAQKQVDAAQKAVEAAKNKLAPAGKTISGDAAPTEVKASGIYAKPASAAHAALGIGLGGYGIYAEQDLRNKWAAGAFKGGVKPGQRFSAEDDGHPGLFWRVYTAEAVKQFSLAPGGDGLRIPTQEYRVFLVDGHGRPVNEKGETVPAEKKMLGGEEILVPKGEYASGEWKTRMAIDPEMNIRAGVLTYPNQGMFGGMMAGEVMQIHWYGRPKTPTLGNGMKELGKLEARGRGLTKWAGRGIVTFYVLGESSRVYEEFHNHGVAKGSVAAAGVGANAVVWCAMGPAGMMMGTAPGELVEQVARGHIEPEKLLEHTLPGNLFYLPVKEAHRVTFSAIADSTLPSRENFYFNPQFYETAIPIAADVDIAALLKFPRIFEAANRLAYHAIPQGGAKESLASKERQEGNKPDSIYDMRVEKEKADPQGGANESPASKERRAAAAAWLARRVVRQGSNEPGSVYEERVEKKKAEYLAKNYPTQSFQQELRNEYFKLATENPAEFFFRAQREGLKPFEQVAEGDARKKLEALAFYNQVPLGTENSPDQFTPWATAQMARGAAQSIIGVAQSVSGAKVENFQEQAIAKATAQRELSILAKDLMTYAGKRYSAYGARPMVAQSDLPIEGVYGVGVPEMPQADKATVTRTEAAEALTLLREEPEQALTEDKAKRMDEARRTLLRFSQQYENKAEFIRRTQGGDKTRIGLVALLESQPGMTGDEAEKLLPPPVDAPSHIHVHLFNIAQNQHLPPALLAFGKKMEEFYGVGYFLPPDENNRHTKFEKLSASQQTAFVDAAMHHLRRRTEFYQARVDAERENDKSAFSAGLAETGGASSKDLEQVKPTKIYLGVNSTAVLDRSKEPEGIVVTNTEGGFRTFGEELEFLSDLPQKMRAGSTLVGDALESKKVFEGKVHELKDVNQDRTFAWSPERNQNFQKFLEGEAKAQHKAWLAHDEALDKALAPRREYARQARFVRTSVEFSRELPGMTLLGASWLGGGAESSPASMRLRDKYTGRECALEGEWDAQAETFTPKRLVDKATGAARAMDELPLSFSDSPKTQGDVLGTPTPVSVRLADIVKPHRPMLLWLGMAAEACHEVNKQLGGDVVARIEPVMNGAAVAGITLTMADGGTKEIAFRSLLEQVPEASHNMLKDIDGHNICKLALGAVNPDAALKFSVEREGGVEVKEINRKEGYVEIEDRRKSFVRNRAGRSSLPDLGENVYRVYGTFTQESFTATEVRYQEGKEWKLFPSRAGNDVSNRRGEFGGLYHHSSEFALTAIQERGNAATLIDGITYRPLSLADLLLSRRYEEGMLPQHEHELALRPHKEKMQTLFIQSGGVPVRPVLPGEEPCVTTGRQLEDAMNRNQQVALLMGEFPPEILRQRIGDNYTHMEVQISTQPPREPEYRKPGALPTEGGGDAFKARFRIYTAAKLKGDKREGSVDAVLNVDTGELYDMRNGEVVGRDGKVKHAMKKIPSLQSRNISFTVEEEPKFGKYAYVYNHGARHLLAELSLAGVDLYEGWKSDEVKKQYAPPPPKTPIVQAQPAGQPGGAGVPVFGISGIVAQPHDGTGAQAEGWRTLEGAGMPLPVKGDMQGKTLSISAMKVNGQEIAINTDNGKPLALNLDDAVNAASRLQQIAQLGQSAWIAGQARLPGQPLTLNLKMNADGSFEYDPSVKPPEGKDAQKDGNKKPPPPATPLSQTQPRSLEELGRLIPGMESLEGLGALGGLFSPAPAGSARQDSPGLRQPPTTAA